MAAGIAAAAAARRPGFAAQSSGLSSSEGFSLDPTQVLGATWVLPARGLALPARTPVPGRWLPMVGLSPRPGGPACPPGCLGCPPNPQVLQGEAGAARTHPGVCAGEGLRRRRWQKAGDSCWWRWGGHQPPGTFETQDRTWPVSKNAGEQLSAPGGCWGSPRGAKSHTGAPPRPAPQPGPPQHPLSHGCAAQPGETPGCPQPPCVPASRDSPRATPGSPRAGERYRGWQSWAGSWLPTLIAAAQAGPWLRWGVPGAHEDTPERVGACRSTHV